MNATATRDFLRTAIKTTSVLLLSKARCPRCQQVESLFASFQIKPQIIHVDLRHDSAVIEDTLKKTTGDSVLPKLFLGGTYFGDRTEIENLHRDGVLEDFVRKASFFSVKNNVV